MRLARSTITSTFTMLAAAVLFALIPAAGAQAAQSSAVPTTTLTGSHLVLPAAGTWQDVGYYTFKRACLDDGPATGRAWRCVPSGDGGWFLQVWIGPCPAAAPAKSTQTAAC
jgi:hypothetical protein